MFFLTDRIFYPLNGRYLHFTPNFQIIHSFRAGVRRFPAFYNSSRSSGLKTTHLTLPISFTTINTLSFNLNLPFFCSSNVRGFYTSHSLKATVPFLLADIGEGITECEVVQWFIKPGDQVAEFQKICELQSDKASVEITSRYSGTISKLHYEVGQMAKVGSPIVNIETIEPTPDVSAPSNLLAEQKSYESTASSIGPNSLLEEKNFTFATPAVRRIARENSVDLSEVQGTGKGGRVSKEDLFNYVAKRSIPLESKFTNLQFNQSVTAEDKIVGFSNIQKAMYKSMTRSLQIPHFGYSDEYIMDNVIAFRNALNEQIQMNSKNLSSQPKKISLMPFFIKTFSTALIQYPILNATILDAEDVNTAKIHYRAAHNIGIAMDTPGGLIVPNIKNVERKSILDIADDLARLQQSTENKTISPADFKDGTITLSNIGVIGGEYLSPVVVSSELCLGAIGKIRRLPRFEIFKDEVTGHLTEKVVGKSIVKISFCADHRVVDGATLARFSETWRHLLENPVLLSAKLR
ncbi:hypothetical protein G9A89_004769 [Geosiphon pyriformis]|nr:hypothetical protein G9A89_004769 [Geosiphon pyriformis]